MLNVGRGPEYTSSNCTPYFCRTTLHKKMNFSIKDFSSKCDQIRSKLRIWPHLLKKSLMEKFIICAVQNDCRIRRNIEKSEQNP